MTFTEVRLAWDESVGEVIQQRDRILENPDRDFVRERKVPLRTLLDLLVILGGDTTKNAIFDFFEAQGPTILPSAASLHPSESAVIRQRKKLKPEGMEILFAAFSQRVKKCIEKEEWPASGDLPEDLDFVAVDGTSMVYESGKAYSPEAYLYPQSGGRCDLYVQKLTAAYSLNDNLFTDGVIHGPGDGDEQDDLCTLVDRAAKREPNRKHVYLVDRGFGSWNCIAHILEAEDYFVMRVKDIGSNGIASSVEIDEEFLNGTEPLDIDVTFRIGYHLPVTAKYDSHVYNRNVTGRFDYLEKDSFKTYPMNLRLLRFRLPSGEYELILTNLPRKEYPEEVLYEFYGLRWDEEVGFRGLKYTIGDVHFHAKLAKLVTQEIWASLIAFNFTTAVVGGVPVSETEQPSCEPSPVSVGEDDVKGHAVSAEISDLKVRREANFAFAAHVVRRNFVGGKLPDDAIQRIIRRYVQKVDLGRHAKRLPHIRRRFYLNYRAS